MSYCNFYKMKEVPFTNVPDLRYFFDQQPYSEAIEKINSAITNEKRLVLVLGNCGVGKTFISRRILTLFEKSPAYEPNLLVCLHSDMGAGWFLQKLAFQLHIEAETSDKYRLFEAICSKIAQFGQSGRQNVAMIDEANRIEKPEVFEEIRGLLDVMADSKFRLSLILFGLPYLEKQMSLDEPLLQRVESRITLKPLSGPRATKQYVEYRLKIAGRKEPIFEDAAYPVIYIASHGNPRLINIICDNALTEGYLAHRKTLGEKDVERVIIEMGYNTRLKTLFLDSLDTPEEKTLP